MDELQAMHGGSPCSTCLVLQLLLLCSAVDSKRIAAMAGTGAGGEEWELLQASCSSHTAMLLAARRPWNRQEKEVTAACNASRPALPTALPAASGGERWRHAHHPAGMQALTPNQ